MKFKLSYLLLILSFSVAFQSCDKGEERGAYDEWKQENEKFIDKIKNDPSYLQASIPQGPGIIYYKESISGQGVLQPISTSEVKVRYKGSLIDGYEFDSSGKRTVEFKVNGVVDGFSTALQNMKEGDVWKVCIPWDLGYGVVGKLDVTGKYTIPPYSTLIFELELVEISKY